MPQCIVNEECTIQKHFFKKITTQQNSGPNVMTGPNPIDPKRINLHIIKLDKFALDREKNTEIEWIKLMQNMFKAVGKYMKL